MRKVLIINPFYYPGYRSGGPQQTFMNIVEAYGDEFDFYILTLDHDMGCDERYPDIREGWNRVGKAKVKYLSDRNMTEKAIAETAERMDVVYAGGLFEKTTRLAMEAHRRKLIQAPFWVAPMGVFSEGAFRQKRLKKELYLLVGKCTGLFRNVSWSFTSELELADFRKHMGVPENYEIASDIPRAFKKEAKEYRKKEAGELRIVFLSRICLKKNLAYAAEVVGRLKGEIIFDIYGPKEDLVYWKECKREFARFASNIKWEYKGIVESSRTVQVFSEYDVFLFPTSGENFGHVIYEALMAGCIPVISDTTPWSGFEEKKCGKIVGLQDISKFQKVLQEFVEMQDKEFGNWRKNAVREAERVYRESVDRGGIAGYSTLCKTGGWLVYT